MKKLGLANGAIPRYSLQGIGSELSSPATKIPIFRALQASEMQPEKLSVSISRHRRHLKPWPLELSTFYGAL